jgi:SNF family Na+-dependent transporter
MNQTGAAKESWASRVGVILAVTGSAVGLGNFLRFPGLAAQYEGGAFMVPYFIALLVLGLPLAWGEWAMGRYGGRHGYNSSPGIYRSICKHNAAAYLGVLGMIVPVVIYMYYVLIESWCLGYAWYYLSGQMAEIGGQARQLGEAGLVSKQPYVELFNAFTGATGSGAAFQGPAVGLLALCFVLNFVLIYRGLSRGIERFCMIAMPALIVCAVLVLFRVLTLPGVLDGLGFMWNPRTEDKGFLEALSNPKMWLDATGQIFFSLSVGFGIIITYASYLKKDDDIALSSLTSASGNEFCEVALGGMITVPAAYMFLGAAAVTAAAGSSFNLGFMTLPMVFESMPLGHFAGFLFFFLLFLAAVTSSLSMLQPAIALLEEGLAINRRTSVAILGFVTMCGAMFTLYFSKDNQALGTLDTWVGTFFIYLLAMFQTILFGWVLGPKRGMDELRRGAEISVPGIVGWNLRYVAPVFLGIIFLAFLYQQIVTEKGGMFRQIVEDPVVGAAVGFIVLVMVFFLLIISQAVKRWERAEQEETEVRL